MQLQDAKQPYKYRKEAVLDKEINLITKKYADQTGPAEVLMKTTIHSWRDSGKYTINQSLPERFQNYKETTDQPGQTPEIETEVSETERQIYFT